MTGSIQVSTKLNDGTIVVIAGTSAANFAENAREMVGPSGAEELKALFYKLIPVSSDDGGVAVVTQAFNATPVPEYAPTPAASFPAAAPRGDAGPPPGQSVPSCTHGPRIFKEGAKNGRAWSGWWCAGPQAEACPKIWNK